MMHGMASNNRSQGGRPGMMRGGPMGRGGPMAMMKGEKPRDFKGTLKKLIQYLSQYRLLVLFVWLLAIGSTVASIVGPKILGKATTKLFEGVMAKIGGTGTIDFTYIGHIIVTVLLLYLLSAVLAYIQGWVMTNVSMNISYRFRKDISEKINRMPFKYFDGTSHGEVLSRITNDVDTVSQTLNQSLTQIITSVTTVIGVVVMMFSISWQMTLVALIMLPISFGIISLIIGKSQVFFKRQQDYLGHINGHVEEMYGSHAVVKAFNGEAKSIRKFDSFNGVLYETSWKSQFLSGLMFPIMGFVGNLGYVAVAVLGEGSNQAVVWEEPNERRAIERLARRLKREGGGAVRCCYEAGPTGYALQRQLIALGVDCRVIAPSLTPVQPGVRIKTDRRDARKLAELFRAGLLTEVQAPNEADEALRVARNELRHAVVGDLCQFFGCFDLTKGFYRWGAERQHLPIVVAELVHDPEAGVELDDARNGAHALVHVAPVGHHAHHALPVGFRKNVRKRVDLHVTFSSLSRLSAITSFWISLVPS